MATTILQAGVGVGELERPLVPDENDAASAAANLSFHELPRDYDLEGACYPNEAHFRSPRTHGQELVHKQRFHSFSPSSNLPPGDTLILDVISHPSQDVDVDVDVGQTLKFTPSHIAQIPRHSSTPTHFQNDKLQDFVQRDISDQSNFFTLFLFFY